jgi:hypothetical protein
VGKINLLQADDKVIKLINFYSISGNVIATTDPNYLDYSLRFRGLYDTCQKSIATTAKSIRKTKKISQYPIVNQLSGQAKTFDIVQHLAGDIIYSATGSRAYCFKVDNISSVYIEEETSVGVWGVLNTITHTAPTLEFTEYKGLINPSNVANSIRIRFSGSYIYNIRDIAMFAYTFPSAGVIPSYSEYNLYTMPTDFYKLNKLISKGSPSLGDIYNPSTPFYWEDSNVLAVKYDYVGEFTVDYSAYPATIDDVTVNTYDFEVDTDAVEAIPYYVASMMMMHENPSIGNKLFALYQGMVMNLDNNVPTGQKTVTNTLFSSAGNPNTIFNKFEG